MTEFPKNYDPKNAERKWYDFWSKKGYFRPEVNPEGEPYSIVIPPPNVTGSLHMGHALNATLQDVLVRWKRMLGQRALWLPGTDHAGIATQNVVERQLAKDGLDRHTLKRDKFIEEVWKWKGEYGGRITHQLRKIGASCDWSRERFTLDDWLSKAVREVFVRLYEDGLIYRDTKLINWCPRCQTALSDLEVEHEEIEGSLTYIKYPFHEGGHITVATTRPETMLGDTAVAVNPKDERYTGMVGKKVELPLTGREIPIVADPEVDPEFGTGAVKVTPGHDFNDEAVAKRQSPPLPSITVIGDDGRMTRHAGARFDGMDRYEARRLVLEDLGAKGYIDKEEKHVHSVGHCYRCKTTIEPLLKPQWYVSVKPLAEKAIEAVKEKKLRIIPETWENSYFAWMNDIRDWCISRQIWWGHRIPVWYCEDCREITVARETPESCKCGSRSLRQDEDVLDTWFSSALWPFSTMGWPEATDDLKRYYPTSVLVTAFDILFFWVARMIMMGLRFMGDVPFRDVYIHAIVRDAEGQKMSKSKGNVIDPLTIIDKYGADAFRFTLAAFAAQGRDIKFSEERLQGYRHFINKLWNASRFIMMNLKDGDSADGKPSDTVAGRWILSRLAGTAEEVNSALDSYRFNDAAGAVYHFIWHEFCDWYIEMAKTEISDAGTRATLLKTLDTVLRMLHPFMPFLTEELWQIYRERFGDVAESLAVSSFPSGLKRDLKVERDMKAVTDAITAIRNVRGTLNIAPSLELKVHIKTEDAGIERTLRDNIQYITRLARTGEPTTGPGVKRPAGSATSVCEGMEVYVPLEGLIDISAETERLTKEKRKIEESIEFTGKKLGNHDFLKNAPEAVVAKERAKFDELVRKKETIESSIEKLGGLGV